MSILIIQLLEYHFHGHAPSDAGVNFVYTNTDGVDHIAALRVSCLADLGNNALYCDFGQRVGGEVTL